MRPAGLWPGLKVGERALALTQQVLRPEAPGTNRVRSNLSRIILS